MNLFVHYIVTHLIFFYYYRLWSVAGKLLLSLSSVARAASPITAVCCDAFANYVITGDTSNTKFSSFEDLLFVFIAEGYVTLWDVSELLQNAENADTINPEWAKYLICWRAHSMKVVSLVYLDSSDTLITASTDGSVR